MPENLLPRRLRQWLTCPNVSYMGLFKAHPSVLLTDRTAGFIRESNEREKVRETEMEKTRLRQKALSFHKRDPGHDMSSLLSQCIH